LAEFLGGYCESPPLIVRNLPVVFAPVAAAQSAGTGAPLEAEFAPANAAALPFAGRFVDLGSPIKVARRLHGHFAGRSFGGQGSRRAVSALLHRFLKGPL